MALDYGMNAKYSKLGENVNLMVYLSSEYHLMGIGILDLPLGRDNYHCGEE